LHGVASNQKITITEGLTSVGESGDLPSETKLFQNYPNPFNPVTVIRYGVAREGHVKIGVFDALGREVDVLVDWGHVPGTYETVFNASSLASGVYYYRLSSGTTVESRRLLLVK
jgi:hypothetical protein